ncbi:hypothetical protein C2845_PM15G03440 [Panicum miliaceum]|uniref:Uncharacterized protein n=1 Tax=Panicum miliaceum TaxID=4540 RepID=A0A3L6Q7S4_PANMI|nr:hypothetical protein C2845_PM15G03440 [Panicum miliaceum]
MEKNKRMSQWRNALHQEIAYFLQENSVVPVSKTGGTGSDSGDADDHSSIESKTSHQPSEVSTAPRHSFLNTNNVKCPMTKGKKKKGSEIEKFDFELEKMTKKDKKNVLELIKRVRQQSDELTRQQTYRESFKKELEKLKEGYACVTNILSCVTSSKEENKQLKDQLEKL